MQNLNSKLSPKAAIGIFDSGIGGVTVMRELVKRMPGERIIYFADSARFPYGNKSPHTVTKFAADIVRFLLRHEVKLIIAACNSASAMALPALKQQFEVPVLGVIEPGAKAAVEKSAGGNIGVIGTSGTVQSGAYNDAIKKLNPDAQVHQRACPLFVSLVEEGWIDKEATRLVVHEYLQPLKELDVDVLLLGCTHYPLLKNVIGEFMGEGVALVDSAASCAFEADRILTDHNIKSPPENHAEYTYFTTDAPDRFKRLGEEFLGMDILKVNLVNDLGD